MENKKFYQQTNIVRKVIRTRTYSCPECQLVLFSVPETVPIPGDKEIVTCKNNHNVNVPKYDSAEKIYDKVC